MGLQGENLGLELGGAVSRPTRRKEGENPSQARGARPIYSSEPQPAAAFNQRICARPKPLRPRNHHAILRF